MATIGTGILQYSHSKDQEFRKAFWEKRYELYSEVTDLAAKISVSEDLDKVKNERKAFWHLYWGRMSIVESKAVYDAMVLYGQKLKSLEPSGNTSPDLQQLSYKLARACRNSLKNTWEPVLLDDIPENRVWDIK